MTAQGAEAIYWDEGWNFLFNAQQYCQLQVAWRIATASEPSSYAIDHSSGGMGGNMYVYRGVDTSNPIDTFTKATIAATTTPVGPSILIANIGNALIFAATYDYPNLVINTPPPTMTERIVRYPTPAHFVYEEIMDATGASGTRSATGSRSDQWSLGMISINKKT